VKRLLEIIKQLNKLSFLEFYRNVLGWYFALIQKTEKDGKSGWSFATLVYVRNYHKFVFYWSIKLPLV